MYNDHFENYNIFPIALVLNVYVDKVQYRKQELQRIFTMEMSFGEELKWEKQFSGLQIFGFGKLIKSLGFWLLD